MRNLLTTALAGTGLLICSLTANAQYRDQDRYPYNNQYGYQQNGGDHDWVFDRLQRDLDRASASATGGAGDRMRIERARQELNQLQASVDTGNFDRRDIDRAAMALQEVTSSNRMPDWARNRLSDDLSQLRDNFRSSR